MSTPIPETYSHWLARGAEAQNEESRPYRHADGPLDGWEQALWTGIVRASAAVAVLIIGAHWVGAL